MRRSLWPLIGALLLLASTATASPDSDRRATVMAQAKIGRLPARQQLGAEILRFQLNQVNRIKVAAGEGFLDPQLDRATGMFLFWPGFSKAVPLVFRRPEIHTREYEEAIWTETTPFGTSLNLPLRGASNDGTPLPGGIRRWPINLADPAPPIPSDGGSSKVIDRSDMGLVAPVLMLVRRYKEVHGTAPLTLEEAFEFFDLQLVPAAQKRLKEQYRMLFIRVQGQTVAAEALRVEGSRFLVLGADGRFSRPRDAGLGIDSAITIGDLLEVELLQEINEHELLPSMEQTGEPLPDTNQDPDGTAERDGPQD